VQDSGEVSRLEGARNLDTEPEAVASAQQSRIAYPIIDRAARVIRHDDVGFAAIGDIHMQDAHDVWVAGKPSHRALLTHEAGQILFVMVGVEDFDRDSAVQAGFDAPIDSTESALPDPCDVRKAGTRQLRDDRVRVGALSLCRICACHRRRSQWRWVSDFDAIRRGTDAR
jgi:hypothetical protein